MSPPKTDAELLQEVEKDIDAARRHKKTSSVASLSRTRLEIIDRMTRTTEDPGEAPSDPLDHHLWELRNLRRQAVAASSMTAAAGLLKQEADILERIEARDLRRDAAVLGEVSEVELLDQFTGALETLPDTTVDKLAEVIHKRQERRG